MRIVSWNVNGLRACGKTCFKPWFQAADADIILLQEVRAEPDQLEPELREIPGYDVAFYPAEKKGYSGVAAYVRRSLGPFAVRRGIGMPEVDHEGRVLTVSLRDLHIISLYAINGGKSEEAFATKLVFLDRLTEFNRSLLAQGGSVVMAGDFNVAHTAIDIADPVGNRDAVGFRPIERAWVDRHLAAGFADCFRRFHPGLEKQFTWWSNRPGVRAKNHGWRIDYATVDEGLWPRVVRAWHEPMQMGSDHCPVGLELK